MADRPVGVAVARSAAEPTDPTAGTAPAFPLARGAVQPACSTDSSAPAIPLIRWPAERAGLSELAARGTPRLLVVDDREDPPVSSDCCQDWLWASAPHHEVRTRLRQLAARALSHGKARPTLDDLGILRFALRAVPLAPLERRLARPLLDAFGGVVAKRELTAAAWPDGPAREHRLVSCVARLRQRVAAVGLEIRSVPGVGYALCAGRDPWIRATEAFDDDLELEAPRR